jgi:uncharacterized protein (TIGR02246 family)
VCVLASPAVAAPSVRAEIEPLLLRQAEAWTEGDLEAFCAVYADDATFIAPSGRTKGRQAVLDRYRAKYKGKAEMGALALTILEVRSSGQNAASVIARWTLTWPDRPKAEGLTLLVFQRTQGVWRIVQDASM